MCFSNLSGGLSANLSAIDERDTVKILFSQNPGIIIQVRDENEVAEILLENGISYLSIGHPVSERTLYITNGDFSGKFDINYMRDKWFRTSYLLDRRQTGADLAKERFNNYSKHAVKLNLADFRGTFKSLGISPRRRKKSGVRSAIIREKGVNGDREMAYALYLAGFDVRDVHMTDLISGRETLEDINMIVFVGGFSNSDVLGSAKGWAGAFRYNKEANKSLERFYKRDDTLSLGVCNGCQLMAELGLIYPHHDEMPRLLHNRSGKFESAFLGVRITENRSVMLGNLSGMELGIWIAHGEGQFRLPYTETRYNIPMKYSGHAYPANPNGSDYNAAGLCSDDGRHLVMMPHIERSFFPWQCGYYPSDRKNDDVTPWMKAFVNARKWIESASAYRSK
jgi:phosphoribosylformylglycinamidine synthase